MIDPLQRAHDHLRMVGKWKCINIPHGWRFALFGILLERNRIKREKLNLWFLLECRRHSLVPNFIKNCSKNYIANATEKHKYDKANTKFHKEVLNMTISDSFRKLNSIEMTLTKKLDWVKQQPESTARQEALDFITVYGDQIDAVLERDKRSRQKMKLDVLYEDRVKELRQAEQPKSRVHCLDHNLSEDQRKVLSYGPNFAILDNSKREMMKKSEEAEVGLERYFYGKRWAYHATSNSAELFGRMVESEGLQTERGKEEKKLEFRNPEASKKQPPKIMPIVEKKMMEVKSEILQEYSRPVQRTSNLEKKERVALKELKKDKSLIIKPSDKDKQFVVAKKTTYVEHVSKLLSDTKTYEHVNKNPISHMTKNVENVIDIMSKKYPILSDAKPYLPRLPEFYCLYKTHKNKDPPPCRPVTSQVDSPAERLGAVVNHILQQLMSFLPGNLLNSQHLREEVRNVQVDPSTILFTADVTSLYTNVPLEHGVEVITKFVGEKSDEINMLGIDLDDFGVLLKLVTESGYFRFDEHFYRQIDGLGMGVRAAPPFAIIYVYLTVEKPLLECDFEYSVVSPAANSIPTTVPHLWKRYVDDCFGTLTGNLQDVDKLFEYVNSLNPSIQFTHEASRESVDFLDMTLRLDTGNREIAYELFVKPSNKGIFLNYTSAHPMSMIRNTAKGEVRRAINSGSSPHYENQGIMKIERMLSENGYPTEVITSIVREVQSEKLNKAHDISPPEIVNTEKVDKQYLCLPYVSEQHKRKVYTILRKNDMLKNTRVIFKPGNKLKNHLTRTALNPTQCNRRSEKTCYDCGLSCMVKNVVYQLTCTLCSETYVGETGRFKRSRCWEHFKSARDGKRDTAMGRHYLQHHRDTPFPERPFDFEVLRKCKDFTDRMLWQSYHIKKLNPKMNTQLSRDTDCWNKRTWAID